MGIIRGADPVVQVIIAVLMIISVFSWSIMMSRSWAILTEQRHTRAVNKALAAVTNETDLTRLVEMSDGQVNRVLMSMQDEWQWSRANRVRNYQQMRERVLSIAELAISLEARKLTGHTALLATIGSVAPFIGLFGTVWGIMGSFIAIGQAQDTSLAIVAPGIAEALMATAVGLFCAIPAVVGYNRILSRLSDVDSAWRSIAVQIEVAISRHYESDI